MSKVDMSVFEELMEICGTTGDMDEIIYGLAGGDLDFIPYNGSYTDEQLTAGFGYEWIEGDTGGEGQGEHCYGVFKLRDKYYRANWSYYSHHGCDYDYIASTLREVTPSQVTITVYK